MNSTSVSSISGLRCILKEESKNVEYHMISYMLSFQQLAKAGRDFPRQAGNTIPEAIESATQIRRPQNRKEWSYIYGR